MACQWECSLKSDEKHNIWSWVGQGTERTDNWIDILCRF